MFELMILIIITNFNKSIYKFTCFLYMILLNKNWYSKCKREIYCFNDRNIIDFSYIDYFQ